MRSESGSDQPRLVLTASDLLTKKLVSVGVGPYLDDLAHFELKLANIGLLIVGGVALNMLRGFGLSPLTSAALLLALLIIITILTILSFLSASS